MLVNQYLLHLYKHKLTMTSDLLRIKKYITKPRLGFDIIC